MALSFVVFKQSLRSATVMVHANGWAAAIKRSPRSATAAVNANGWMTAFKQSLRSATAVVNANGWAVQLHGREAFHCIGGNQ